MWTIKQGIMIENELFYWYSFLDTSSMTAWQFVIYKN